VLHWIVTGYLVITTLVAVAVTIYLAQLAFLYGELLKDQKEPTFRRSMIRLVLIAGASALGSIAAFLWPLLVYWYFLGRMRNRRIDREMDGNA